MERRLRDLAVTADPSATLAEQTRTFARMGARMRLHARCLDCGAEVGTEAERPVVLASVVKVLLVLEFARQAAAGQLDPAERAVVGAPDRLGGTGTAGCADDVEMSLRDLARQAMSVSDNSAADVLFRRVGTDTVRVLAQQLGLDGTRVLGGPRTVLEGMWEDLGADSAAEFAEAFAALPTHRVRDLSFLDPARTNATTARDMTRLLTLMWTDRAGAPNACGRVRSLMGEQVSWHRLQAAFPPEVTVAAKSGTLPGVRNEVGVVTWPDGARFAVAVFAETDSMATRRPDLDTAIGAAARTAIGFLWGCRAPSE